MADSGGLETELFPLNKGNSERRGVTRLSVVCIEWYILNIHPSITQIRLSFACCMSCKLFIFPNMNTLSLSIAVTMTRLSYFNFLLVHFCCHLNEAFTVIKQALEACRPDTVYECYSDYLKGQKTDFFLEIWNIICVFYIFIENFSPLQWKLNK